jgi:2,4-dienoyl-CoA reductase-like NADH-dependent reductase (Old Yellow Enzyme family)
MSPYDTAVAASLPIAQPYTLPNGGVLPNRLVKSAMSEALGSMDNRVTPRLVALYRRWAASGIGLVITGNVMIDRRALGEPGNVALEDERDLALLRLWAAAGKSGGGQIWMQINHPGKQCPRGLNRETVAPSAVPFGPSMSAAFATPRELGDAEIIGIIERYARAAAIARKAGFDGVQLHGAHGYLISQFLSPRHNLRTDRWGGTPAKRRHFVLEVFKAVREAVGPKFPIGIKLNSADFQRGGFTEDESLATIAALAKAGIAMVEISGGTYEAPAMAGAMKDSTREREAYFLDFANKVRAKVRVPLLVTGGFRSLAGMNAPLLANELDFIGLARSLAVEPDLPARLLKGQEARHPVKPIRTGIKMVDRMAIMEVSWYTRQLKRIADGGEPKPDESGLQAFFGTVASMGLGTFRTLRARG